ncbi:MAG: tetratricopeptide repeat protein [Sedimentisphaerales bacterium]|nr:tetratricopeptide repeat protein [Sedimentisphaerales bacterium]
MTIGTNKKQILFITASLVVTTLIAYEPMRHNGFVSYDDTTYITGNPNVNEGITRQSVIWAFTKQHAANWHPLTWLSHTMDCQLFGLNPFWHHLVSLIFHTTNALLLFWIFTKITGAIWPSAFVAAVFALHPLQVESVAWAAERKTVLSGLFWLLTRAIYIWYTKRPGIGRYILLFLVYGLCIMTKPSVVTLPLVLLLLDYWPIERFDKHPQAHLFIEKIPLLGLSAILSVMTVIAQKSGGFVIATLDVLPLVYRIANMFLSYIRYIGKIIWPSGLAIGYPYPHVDFSNIIPIVCLLIFVAITILSIYTLRRKKYMAVGWLWFVGTLVPMIGLVQVSIQAMADRYMYLSMVGLLIIIAWSVKDIIAKWPNLKVVACVSATVILLSMLILTRMQVRHWQNTIELYGHALKATSNSFVAEFGYGCEMFKSGRLAEAELHLGNAVRIDPANLDARRNLGVVLMTQGKLDEAIDCFNEILKNNNSLRVHYYLATALCKKGNFDEAIKHLSTVITLDPKHPDAHNKMGIALLATGKPNEAIEYFNEAIRETPNQAEIYENLGQAYKQLGRYKPAVQNLTKAVKLKYNNRPDVLNALAWLLATAGDVSAQDANRAVEYAQHACELTGHREPHFLDTLAAAYAAGGSFEDAVRTAQQAIDAAKAGGREDLAGEIKNRMELYKMNQRYRQK